MDLNGLVARQGLQEAERKQIRELADRCEAYEGIELKLNWDLLLVRPSEETNDMLYYGEDGRLIGFLGIYMLSPAEAELTGMVDPDYRRHGIATQMLQAAMQELRHRSPESVLFVCPGHSASGKAMLRQLEAEYEFTEYSMLRSRGQGGSQAESQTGESRSPAPELQLRRAIESDAGLLVELNREGFGMTEEEAAHFAELALGAEETTLLAVENGRAVGKLSYKTELRPSSNPADQPELIAYIYGFCMLPEVRGRGLGRAALSQLVERLESELGVCQFRLEVAATNDRALGLYVSCGFRVIGSIDYYRAPVR